jgi:hypothetical protein
VPDEEARVPRCDLANLVESRGGDFADHDVVRHAVAAAIRRDAFDLERREPERGRKVVDQQPSTGLQGSEEARIGRGGVRDVVIDADHVGGVARARRKPSVGRRRRDHRDVGQAGIGDTLLDVRNAIRIDLGRVHVACPSHLLGHPRCHLAVAGTDLRDSAAGPNRQHLGDLGGHRRVVGSRARASGKQEGQREQTRDRGPRGPAVAPMLLALGPMLSPPMARLPWDIDTSARRMGGRGSRRRHHRSHHPGAGSADQGRTGGARSAVHHRIPRCGKTNWKWGIVRENYSRVDEPGVVLVFEVENAEAAMRWLADFPMTKAGYLEWTCIPVTAPFPLEAVFTEAALARVKMPDSELEWAKGQKATP